MNQNNQLQFFERVSRLRSGEKTLLKTFIALALVALFLGVIYALLVVSGRAGFLTLGPNWSYKLLTLHAATVFYYWFYFMQAAFLLVLWTSAVGQERLSGFKTAWLALVLMASGFFLTQIAPLFFRADVLYDAMPPLAGQFPGTGYFYLGYVLLFLGFLLLNIVGLCATRAAKRERPNVAFSSIGFAGVIWAVLAISGSIAGLVVFSAGARWALGFGDLQINYHLIYSFMFHNMHYLPLLSTVLIWYVLAEATTGIKTIYGERFSKGVFLLYLFFMPPTFLYHLFLDPSISEVVKAMGSGLALLIGVPTVLVFLIIASSIESSAKANSELAARGWFRSLPWRNPAFAAMALAIVSAFGGGMVSYVLQQKNLAELLSDTFAVPGYFHFFTVGMVTLTFLGLLCYLLPALTGRRLWGARWLSLLPYGLTLGVYLFGVAGVAAGFLGVPRRPFDISYGGAAPPIWESLMALVGVGGLLMVLVLGGFILILGRGFIHFRREPAGQALEELPALALTPVRMGMGRAPVTWIATVLLIVAMWGLTSLAFEIMRSWPIMGG